MNREFHREYQIRLPLPLAQLYRRANDAKDARSLHENIYYLFEAAIKLAVAPGVSCYLKEIDQGALRVSALDAFLSRLALPSFGHWVGMLRELARHFGTRPDASSHPLGHLWRELNEPRRDSSGLLGLYCRIKNGADGEPVAARQCSLLEVFDALVQYRNGVQGHGGPRFDSFYEKEMGPLLFPAVNDFLADGSFPLFGPRGSRLVYLTELRIIDDNRVEVGLRELIGLHGERSAPLMIDHAEADGLSANSVAVLWPGRSVPLPLDPLIQYREGELADELLFLNRDRNGRQVEYLSYTTGRTERDRTMTAAVAAMLTRVHGRTVDEERLRSLAAQSLAETSSVEAILAPPLSTGLVLGDFEVMAEIGRGGMGVVYLARQLSLGRLVALKMLPADLAGDDLTLARFRREMRLLARCDHPNIVKVLDSGTMSDGRLYYAMEYVPGCNLDQVMRELTGPSAAGEVSSLGSSDWARAVLSASRKHREQTSLPARSAADPTEGGSVLATLPLPPLPELPPLPDDPGGYIRRVARLVRDAALALQAVHDQDVIHRDVKPANLMLTPNGTRVVLMDFGLAKGKSLELTSKHTGGLLGTLRCAAPEQLAAATLKVGPSADVRGLGVTLWELLTRRRLFADAEDEKQLATRISETDVPRLRSIDPSFDPDLEAIVARATQRRASDRIASAGALAEYLQLYLDGKPLPIRPPTPGEIIGRWVRDNRAMVISVGAAALTTAAAVLVALVLVTLSRNSEARANNEAQKRATEASELAGKNKSLALEEEKARKAADQQLRISRLGAYDAHLDRVNKVLENDPGAAADMLADADQCPPDLRDFAWGYLQRLARRERWSIPVEPSPVHRIAFASEGYRFATAGGDGTVRLWTAISGSPAQAVFAGHEGDVWSVTLSPDGRWAASSGRDGTVRLWDLAKGMAGSVLRGHEGDVHAVAYSPDGKTLASSGRDGTVRLWDPSRGITVSLLQRDGPPVSDLAFSPDARCLAGSLADRTVRIWNLKDGTERLTIRVGGGAIGPLAFSPDGLLVAGGGIDRVVRVWDVIKGKEQAVLNGHTRSVTGLAFSADGMSLASLGSDGLIKLWAAADWREVGVLQSTGPDVPTSMAFSADGGTLVSGGRMGTLSYWDVRGKRLRTQAIGHMKSLQRAVYSPDGALIASAQVDGTVRLWDAAHGSSRGILVGHTAPINEVAFAPDGRILASASQDGTVRVWDVSKRRERFILSAPAREGQGAPSRRPVPLAIAFAGDGATLAASGNDGRIRLWDTATGREERSFEIDVWTDAPSSERAEGFAAVPGAVPPSGPALMPDVPEAMGPLPGVQQRGGRPTNVNAVPTPMAPPGAVPAGPVPMGVGPGSVVPGGVPAPGAVPPPGSGAIPPAASSEAGPPNPGVCGPPESTVLLQDPPASPPAPSPASQPTAPDTRATIELTQAVEALARQQLANDVEARIQTARELVNAGHPAAAVNSLRLARNLVRSATNVAEGVRLSLDERIQELEVPILVDLYTVYSLSFAPDGRTLALADAAGRIRLCDRVSGKARVRVGSHRGAASRVQFSPDGQTIASAGVDGAVVLWDPSGSGQKLRLSGYTGISSAFAFAPDGQSFAFDDGESVRVIDLERRLNLAKFAHSYRVSGLTFSRDGRTLAVTDAWAIRAWDLTRRPDRATLAGHASEIRVVAVSPEGRTIATGDRTGALRLWDSTGGHLAELARGSGPSDPERFRGFINLAFSPDGRTLISTASDGSTLAWSVHARRPITKLTDPITAPNEEIIEDETFTTFSSDGRRLAMSTGPQMVSVYDTVTWERVNLSRYDLRLVSSVKDVSALPTAGKRLVIMATVGHALHFRIFDHGGNMIVDMDATEQTAQAPRIKDLRDQLENLCPPHELTTSEKGRVIDAVTSIVGHTSLPDDEGRPVAFAFPSGQGSLLAIHGSGALTSWDLKSQRTTKLAGPGRVERAVFAPDGKTVAVALGNSRSDGLMPVPGGFSAPGVPARMGVLKPPGGPEASKDAGAGVVVLDPAPEPAPVGPPRGSVPVNEAQTKLVIFDVATGRVVTEVKDTPKTVAASRTRATAGGWA